MSKKWNLIIDVAACSNCGNCVLAVKDEHVGNAFPGYAAAQPQKGHKWFWVERVVRGAGARIDVAHVPKSCNHCDDPPCQKAAPDVVVKREDGIVIFDPERAVGRRELVDACPYGAVSWNEEANLPQIWSFDAHLLDAGWEKPRCVQACPTACLSAERLADADMARKAADEDLATLRPDLNTKPRLYYRNLWRASELFIGGNVVGRDAKGRLVNLCDVDVTLKLERDELRHGRTDAFGDFKFDRVLPGRRFQIDLRSADGQSAQRSGVAQESVDLGSIEVSARA